jgi:hypothetical protein
MFFDKQTKTCVWMFGCLGRRANHGWAGDGGGWVLVLCV